MEHYHQITNRQRIQFWMTKDREVRALAMACSMQQYTNPEVETWGKKVIEEVCRGPRQNYITKEAKRKERREKKRAEALQKWELANPECKHPMVPPMAVHDQP